LAIATLPISLFFHDDLSQQRHYLQQTVQAWGGSPAQGGEVIAFGYAIAQALKEQLHPHHFLAQLHSYLRVSAASETSVLAPLSTALEQVDRLLLQGADWHTACLTLNSPAIAGEDKDHPVTIPLALFSFLSTPDAFSVALVRASRPTPQPSLCALTGALAGTYGSVTGIPIAWNPAIAAAGPNLPEAISPLHVRQCAAYLLAHWSGAPHPTAIADGHSPAVAAPWTIRH
jgi:hypothetical protein